MSSLSHIDPRTMPPAEAKSAWRSVVRRDRLKRGERRMVEHADSFRDQVLTLPEVEGIRCVSVYASRAHEPGTLPLIEALHARGIEVLMPRLGDGLVRGWGIFTSAEDISERAPGRPPEPSGDFLPAGRLADADLIVVPALGIDTLGTRLGQGAGWYDRALADARPGVPIVGMVFEDEFHDARSRILPRESHDVAVTIAVTPSSVARIRA